MITETVIINALINTENGEILSKYGPNWLISKSKITLNSNSEINFSLESIFNESKIYTLSELETNIYYSLTKLLEKLNVCTKSSVS